VLYRILSALTTARTIAGGNPHRIAKRYARKYVFRHVAAKRNVGSSAVPVLLVASLVQRATPGVT